MPFLIQRTIMQKGVYKIEYFTFLVADNPNGQSATIFILRNNIANHRKNEVIRIDREQQRS
jgi:hypothetical protein